MCEDVGEHGVAQMDKKSAVKSFKVEAGEPCSMIMINTNKKDFSLKVKGTDVDTYMMSMNFPFETHINEHKSKYTGSQKDNAMVVVVGSTTNQPQTASITYKLGAMGLISTFSAFLVSVSLLAS